ncbi:MAG: hypothetical protein Sapg2KO_27540 [Saprospiraceae bacterium]
MKLTQLLCFCCLLCFWACSSDQAQIQFCTELNTLEVCATSQDTFPSRQRVYFSCQSKTAFPTGKVTGTIYNLSADSEKKYIGEHVFDVTPNTKTLNYYIPFEMYGGFGDYLVEITGPEGELLAADQLYIKTQ